MPAKKVWIRVAEFAELMGVTRQRVDQKINDKVVQVKIVRGVRYVHKVKAKAAWQAHTTEMQKRDKPLEGSAPKIDADGDVTLAEAARREKVWKAQQAELAYLERAGKLVPIDKVQMEAFEIARKARDAIMGIPTRFAHELAVETDPHKLEVMLTKALQKALEDLILKGEFDGRSGQSSEPLQPRKN